MKITVSLKYQINGKITEKTAEAEICQRRTWIGGIEDGEWREDSSAITECARALFESMEPQQWVINGPDGKPAAVATAKEAGADPDGAAYEAWKKQSGFGFKHCGEDVIGMCWHAALKWEREQNRKASGDEIKGWVIREEDERAWFFSQYRTYASEPATLIFDRKTST